MGINAPAKPPTLPELELGTLDGKYLLLREIGSGGAGAVYEAEHLIVGKRVAIKVLHPLAARDETLRARFVGEARAAAQIGHENVIDIHDFGVSAEGSPYLVMDLLDGETLEELMERRGALPPTYACELMVQILAGLGAAHAFGIVHRDLKPANIVVTHPRPDSPLVKILDFGIATGVNGGVHQGDEGLIGTPQYMAPEQALAKPVDERADLYAAGVVLYEMLAGEAPFTGNAAEVLRSVVTGNWRPLASVNPAVPRPLTATVVLAMATDAVDRIQSAHEFAQRLTPYLSHPPPHSVPHGRRSADAFLLTGGTTGEVQFLSDVPGMSRPPRDFPSFDLAKISGKPRGEPIADSMLQSPIIPRAPAAAKIQLFSDSRDLEGWSEAPPRRREDHESDEPPEQARTRGRTDSLGMPVMEDSVARPTWHRAAWVAAFGVGVGAALAWLYGLG
jgi:serine/threonine protein kinase